MLGFTLSDKIKLYLRLENHDNRETLSRNDENTKDEQRKNKFQFIIYQWSAQSFPSNKDVGQHGNSYNVNADIMLVRDRTIRMTLYKTGTSQIALYLTALRYLHLREMAINGEVRLGKAFPPFGADRPQGRLKFCLKFIELYKANIEGLVKMKCGRQIS